MKQLLMSLLFAAVLSCNERLSDEIKESIPGTYTRFSEHEFGKEYDTLVIVVQNKSANEYKILRKWKYERVLDDEQLAPEYKHTETSGIYNAKNRIIEETQTGDIISFDPARNILFAGATQYKKLN
jgi:hypothetical protein